MSDAPPRNPEQEKPEVDLDDPAIIQALAKLIYEAEKRSERSRSIRDLDR